MHNIVPVSLILRRAGSVGLLTLVVGCGDDTTIEINNFQPTQTVEGTATDGISGKPVEGVEVSALYEDAPSAETNDDGYYELKIPQWGVHSLQYLVDGYARTTSSAGTTAVPAAGGEIDIRFLRDIILYPTTATLRGLVTSGGPRNVIEGATVMVNFQGAVNDPSITVEATTDEDGWFELEDLPAGTPNPRIVVMPRDLDDDGIPDTESFVQLLASTGLAPDLTTELFIQVPQFTNDRIVWTNVDDSALLAGDDSLSFVFARPMQPESLTAADVNLSHAGGQHLVGVRWAAGNTELTINPSGDMEAGDTYFVSFNAISAAGQNVGFSSSFRVEGSGEPGEVTGLTMVTDPIPFDMQSFMLAWDSVPGSTAYRVLARNDANQPAWTEIATPEAQPGDRGFYQLFLPFDPFNTMGSTTGYFSPFANGTSVEIAVAALSGNVQGPVSESITVADDECPVLTVAQMATAGPGLERVLQFRINTPTGEPLDPTSSATITFEEGGIVVSGDDTFVLDGATFTSRMLSPVQLVIEGPIGDAENGLEDLFEVDLTGVRDVAGNAPDADECPDTFSGVLF